jgi:type IV pilus assembly protein PilB
MGWRKNESKDELDGDSAEGTTSTLTVAPAWKPRPASETASGPPKRRLGDLLVDRGLVTTDQLSEALTIQSVTKKPLGQLLVDMGALKERMLITVLADQHGLRIVDLRVEVPEPAAIAMITEAVAQGLAIMPVRIEDQILIVATSDPSPDLLAKVEEMVQHSIQLVLAPASDIVFTIANSYRAINDVGRHLSAYEGSAAAIGRSALAVKVQTVDQDAPVVNVVNLLLTQAVRDRASDVHIEPFGDDGVRVRFRIDGTLNEVMTVPPDMGPAIASRLKVMAGLNIVEHRRPQDGQISTELEGKALDIRISTVATIYGEKVVLRLLDKSRPLFKVADLGLSPETRERYERLVKSPFGMLICAGPTGSGKTTTLYATLSEINTIDRNIMTIEDPVEYTFPSINQIQINEAAGITFAGGLRAMMRQDPDVILVGEMRDEETARTAVKAALTGHLVLSSLHATDAPSALHRLLDMGLEGFLITSSVLGVVSQRLLRRICTSCAAPYEPDADELAFYRELGGADKDDFVKGTGCNFCAASGYLERIGVYELMVVTEEIKELVISGATDTALRSQARKQGMTTLREEGLRLVSENVTTIAEVARCIYVL